VIRRISFLLGAAAAGLVGCTTVTEQGTLAELDAVQPDVDEVYLEDGLERAAESYRRYLEETPETARTPEAMRRLADLQIEQAYGVIGTGEVVELAASAAAGSKALQAPELAKPEAADMPGVRAGIRAARIAAPGFAEPGAAGRRYPHGRGR
jgi:hypothetical protein